MLLTADGATVHTKNMTWSLDVLPPVSDARKELDAAVRRRGDAQAEVADAQRRLDECKRVFDELDQKVGKLQRYIAAATDLVNQSGSTEHPDVALRKNGSVQNTDWEVSTTSEVARQILSYGGPMKLDGILLEARKFKRWGSSNSDERDKERLDSALRRGKGKLFIRTERGWDLKERTH